MHNLVLFIMPRFRGLKKEIGFSSVFLVRSYSNSVHDCHDHVLHKRGHTVRFFKVTLIEMRHPIRARQMIRKGQDNIWSEYELALFEKSSKKL